MTDIRGLWDFNGNGSAGTAALNRGMLISEQTPDGTLTVKVTFDGLNRVDPWTGKFDGENITLERQLPGGVTQTHTGAIGTNDPTHLIFGGTFTEPDAGARLFGWFAVFRSSLIL